MYTLFSSINLKGKVSDTQIIATIVFTIYFCDIPYGTPCTVYINILEHYQIQHNHVLLKMPIIGTEFLKKKLIWYGDLILPLEKL